MKKGGDSIQIDKGGFVRIHHTILEVLATAPLRGQQFRCLMFLFRTTYGFNRKEAKISLREWAIGTGMQRQNVWRELQILMKGNVIVAHGNGEKRSMTWAFNKYHEQWRFDSVITDDDKSVVTNDDRISESVITDDDSDEKSVINVDYKSVITRSHTRDLKDNKDTTTTTTEGSGSGSFLNPSFSTVVRYWQENMQCAVTPIIESDLKQLDAEYGESVVIDAIGIAARANKHEMRYVKGVLNRRASAVEVSANGANHSSRKVLVDDD